MPLTYEDYEETFLRLTRDLKKESIRVPISEYFCAAMCHKDRPNEKTLKIIEGCLSCHNCMKKQRTWYDRKIKKLKKQLY
jgi:hypothetical protein